MMKKQNKNKKKRPKPIKEASTPQKEVSDIKNTQTSCKQPNKVIMVLRKTKKIFVNFTSSLWFRIPIIFLFTLIIIRGIFMFSPKNAAVNYESNNTLTISDLNAKGTYISFNNNPLTITSKEEIVICFNKGIINGEKVDYVYPRNPFLVSQLRIVPKDYNETEITIKAINNNLYDSPIDIYAYSSKCNIGNYDMYEKIDMYENINLNGNGHNKKLTISNDEIRIGHYNDFILHFDNCDVFTFDDNKLVKEDVTIQYINEEIDIFKGIVIKKANHSYIDKDEIFTLTIPLDSLSGKAQFFNVSNTSIQGKGELNFTLPSSISKYDLNLIDLYLKSDDNNLVVTCDFSKDNDDYFKANVNGIVNDAKIANYDLFPTFKGWIANNIFLLPTAIISSVLIPILLDISKGLLKKKKDDDKQEE